MENSDLTFLSDLVAQPLEDLVLRDALDHNGKLTCEPKLLPRSSQLAGLIIWSVRVYTNTYFQGDLINLELNKLDSSSVYAEEGKEVL